MLKDGRIVGYATFALFLSHSLFGVVSLFLPLQAFAVVASDK